MIWCCDCRQKRERSEKSKRHCEPCWSRRAEMVKRLDADPSSLAALQRQLRAGIRRDRKGEA